MSLILRFDRQLTRADGDKWLSISALFSEPQLLIDYSPSEVPETWDYLGRIFQQTVIADRWVICDYARIWPNRPTLVRWSEPPATYRCEMRFVRYLKPGRLRVWGVTAPTPLTIGGEGFTIDGVRLSL